MWNIMPYDASHLKEWDEFVDASRNATFLFKRGYMDYHAPRFSDSSLMAYRHGKLAAVLPANITGNTLHSHKGLTYGGWLWRKEGLDTADIFSLWREWLKYCKAGGIEEIEYKPLPYIYASMPSQEDLYMLFLSGAQLIRTDMSTAVDLNHNPGFNKLQTRHLKGASDRVQVRRIVTEIPKEVESFHKLLTRCLMERHTTAPVHSLEEMRLLAMRFPENIKFWEAKDRKRGEIIAGICVYETSICAHCQYIASSAEGRELNALSVIVEDIESYCREKGIRYLDFGISNEKEGRELNIGLNRQKTSYGGSGVAYQRYRINVSCASASLPNELWPRK